MVNKIFHITKNKFWHIKLQWPDFDEDTNVDLSIGIYKLLINIPLWKASKPPNFSDEPLRYGVAYHDATFWAYTGDTLKYIDAPWQWTIVRHDMLLPNGSVYHRNLYKAGRTWGKQLHWYDLKDTKLTLDDIIGLKSSCYMTYTLKDYSEIQNCKVTLYGDEREWRWKCLTWLPVNKLIRRVCDFEFSREMGERSGSWKGGLISATTEWLPTETLEESFRRWKNKWNGQ